MSQARRALAAETVEILERGWYDHPSRRRVPIAKELAGAVAGTRLWGPDEPVGPLAVSPAVATSVEVVNETSLSAARRMVGAGEADGGSGDDRGGLLARPYPVSFLTVAAPNAGAMDEDDERRARLPEVLFERSGRALSLFAASGLRRLVLGAWGCGVFRNSPALVADCFAAHLGPSGAFHGRFERVVFAVLDDTPGTPVHDAFVRAFAGEPG